MSRKPLACPACHTNVAPNDAWCSSCGEALDGSDALDFVPLPGVTGPVDLRIRKRPRVAWYRRPQLVLPLAGLGLAVAGLAVYFPL